MKEHDDGGKDGRRRPRAGWNTGIELQRRRKRATATARWRRTQVTSAEDEGSGDAGHNGRGRRMQLMATSVMADKSDSRGGRSHQRQ